MEFPNLGKHCHEEFCKKLDFLPVKCDACEQIFCHEHMSYTKHSCPSAYKKDVQVPVCPLCNTPIPVRKGEMPDIAVGAHIDMDCQSDPAKGRRKVFVNKCSMKGCKGKEIVPVLCAECRLNFCLKHRYTADHNCQGKIAARRNNSSEAALARQRKFETNKNNRTNVSSIQGSLSEDEALARALQMSLQNTESNNHSSRQDIEIDADEALARALAESERDMRQAVTATQPTGRCSLS
uniref:AN1-type domain-containing protein n=2 Tax=Clastoptera arizonana TaxID=38151 RepID=A0A1B6C7F1_9HEMI